MCRQMNNKQQNCLIFSITHNTMKLKSWRLHTYLQMHTHTQIHKHLTQLAHLKPSTKWYTYIISHSQMCFSAAHILSMNAGIICLCDCCWFHNSTELSAISPRRSSVFRWCVTVLFYLPGSELHSSLCQRVLTPIILSLPLLVLLPLFLRHHKPAMTQNSHKCIFLYEKLGNNNNKKVMMIICLV